MDYKHEEKDRDSAPGDRAAGNSALKPLRGQLHFKPGEKRSWSVDDAIEHIGVGRFHHLLTFFVGVAFASDAMEVVLLSYLQVELRRDWHLSATAAASITSAVFAGQFIGALVFGRLADRWGRRPVFLCCALTTAAAGWLSSYSTAVWHVCLLRFVVGLGIGGFSVPYDLLAELLPTAARASVMLSTSVAWSVGSILTSALAALVLPAGGWRPFLRLCAVPVAGCTLLYGWLPESPRFLVTRGRAREAAEVLRRVGRGCGRELPPFELQQAAPAESAAAPAGTLLLPRFRGLSLALWVAWFCMGLAQYGLVTLLPELFGQSRSQNPHSLQAPRSSDIAVADTVSLDAADYRILIAIASLALPGMLALWALHVYWAPPRRPLLRAAFASGAVCLVVLAAILHAAGGESQVRSKWVLVALSGLSAISMSTQSALLWMYTTEVYPTAVRATGHAVASSFTRVGAFIAPFADNLHMLHGDTHASALLLLALSAALGLLASISLRTETAGRVLKDTTE